MTSFSVAALVKRSGFAKILKRGLELAGLAELPVTSWRTGDPTLSDYTFLADQLAAAEDVIVSNAESAFLSSAQGDWKKLHAQDNFGVTVDEAGYATPTITLENTGVNYYPLAAGDLTAKATAINKTYRNVAPGYDPDTLAPGELGPGVTLKFDLVADEAGSESSVGVDEVDALVTTLEGVEVVGSTASAAADAPDDKAIEALCAESLGPLSPAGPADAYNFVVKRKEYTGTTEITRATTLRGATACHVLVIVASATGPVTPASVALAQTAVERWANPITGIPLVYSAEARAINVVAVLAGNLPSDYAARARGELIRALAKIDIGALVPRSVLIAAIHTAVKECTAVTLVTPAADIQLDASDADGFEAPTLGTTSFSQA